LSLTVILKISKSIEQSFAVLVFAMAQLS